MAATRSQHLDDQDVGVYDALIDAVAGDRHHRLAPDEVNRVLKDLDNQRLYAVGMRSRTGPGGGPGESYRTMTGSSADKGLRAVDTALFDQGHAVCGGVENGKSTVVGFSSGSKIWSN